MARRVLGGSDGEVVAAHHERLVAVGAEVVVKVERDVAAHRREAAILTALAGCGAGVPEVVAATDVDDPAVGVLVLERVPGDPLGEYGREDERFGAETWTAVGAGLARLHACPPPDPAPPMSGHTAPGHAAHVRAWGERDRRQGRDQGWLDAARAARHEELVEALADRVAGRTEAIVHGDCSPQHWLVDPTGGVRPIDLGDAGMGDPAYDLVVLTLTQPHRLDAVLEGYGADAALRAHVAAARPAYVALRLAGEVCWLVDHGFDPTPARTSLAAALA